MGCSFSGLNAFYGAVNGGIAGGDDVWINENRFRILRRLGEGSLAAVYLVKEVGSGGDSGLATKKNINPAHISGDFDAGVGMRDLRGGVIGARVSSAWVFSLLALSAV